MTGLAGLVDGEDIRQRKVNGVAVGGEAPLDAAQQAAASQLLLPDQHAAVVGIERVDLRGLLAHQDHAPRRPWHLREHRRRAEIEIGTSIVGAVVLVVANAGDVPDVLVSQLVVPEDAPGGQIECHGAVAHRRLGPRVVVSGRHVERPAVDIDDRRRPDGDA